MTKLSRGGGEDIGCSDATTFIHWDEHTQKSPPKSSKKGQNRAMRISHSRIVISTSHTQWWTQLCWKVNLTCIDLWVWYPHCVILAFFDVFGGDFCVCVCVCVFLKMWWWKTLLEFFPQVVLWKNFNVCPENSKFILC